MLVVIAFIGFLVSFAAALALSTTQSFLAFAVFWTLSVLLATPVIRRVRAEISTVGAVESLVAGNLSRVVMAFGMVGVVLGLMTLTSFNA